MRAHGAGLRRPGNSVSVNPQQSGRAPGYVGYSAGTSLTRAPSASSSILIASACVLAIRGGRIVFDSAGLTIPDVSRAGPYSNFK